MGSCLIICTDLLLNYYNQLLPQSITVIMSTPRARLNLSYSSNDSAMDIDFSPKFDSTQPGMDSRESTRIRTPNRFRSASSPFASPDVMSNDQMQLSPLIGSSPRVLSQRGQQKLQFKVIRKRRATVQECARKLSENSGETPKRRRPSVQFTRPKSRSGQLSEQDYVLQQDNLVSSPDEARQLAMDKLCQSDVIVTDLIRRRPSAIMQRNKRENNHGDSPVSFRTKRCLSLCSPNLPRSSSRGLRERNRSVNDFNLPKKDLNPELMDNQKLTGDFKRMLSLPTTTTGKCHDLKYIDDKTLVSLQKGEKSDVITTIIDARYPYEFRGGHIKGAVNLYTKDMCLDYFYGAQGQAQGLLNAIGEKENFSSNGPPKHVIVFHCEFSSERAPAMLRFLRKNDRAKNVYPNLDFPELYLLKDGYKNFFSLQQAATTGSYLPMLDVNHTGDLRHFRKKCKTAPSNKI